jgi:hypothetical protein
MCVLEDVYLVSHIFLYIICYSLKKYEWCICACTEGKSMLKGGGGGVALALQLPESGQLSIKEGPAAT